MNSTSGIGGGHTSRTISATNSHGGIIAMARRVTSLTAWEVDRAVSRGELSAKQHVCAPLFELTSDGCAS